MSAAEPRVAARGPVAVTGVGAVTSVGASAAQTRTSIRAGIRRVVERPLAGSGGDAGEEGGACFVASAAALAQVLGAADPVGLALAAAREALWDAGLYEPRDAEAAYRRTSTAVLLALPPAEEPWADPAVPTAFLDGALSARLLERAGTRLLPFRSDHAAGVLALEAASRMLLAAEADVVLLGGVDDLAGPGAVPQLDRGGRLRTDRGPDGLTPGEGSAFLVLERLEEARKRGGTPLATVEGIGTGREPAPLSGPEPSRGEGAARAVSAALAAAASAGRIGDVWVDLNGERNRALEWSLVETRALSGLPPGWRRHVPAAVVGDLGAATATLLLALSADAIRAGRGAGGAALVFAASERGERAAAVLAAPRAAGKG